MAKQPKRLTRAQKIELSRIAAKLEKVKIADRKVVKDLPNVSDSKGCN